MIRPIKPSDMEGLRRVIISSELFPVEYLDEMIADYLNNPNSQDVWFTCIDGTLPTAVGFCIPEKFTSGTYNLLALGVLKGVQRTGVATKMMQFLEKKLREMGARVLIVETSSDDAQRAARGLYFKIGYTEIAVIKDFWSEGEDKIVFWKKL
jgi:ribosomal protein S18 acetylase RimI-like enzyme